jgi:hypothetical protein
MNTATRHLLDYDDQGQEVEVSNPSAELIRECIERLDNAGRANVALTLSSLHLNISGGNNGRVLVMVTKISNQIPVLVLKDPTVNDTREITLLAGDQYVEEPLNETVSKQKAIDVVLYCLENDDTPDGLEWAYR